LVENEEKKGCLGSGTMGTVMYNEQVREAWWAYLSDMFPDPLGELPYFFRDPYCGTCTHWFLINEDGLRHLALTSSPKEYDEIVNDMSGNRTGVYREKGVIKDTYRDHRFYGWCKRFPPVQRSGYSIIGFRTLFTFLSRNIPQKNAEYDFPLMPHSSSCGEWKQGSWVSDFVNKHTNKEQG
jgi:hypothetical protein